MRYYRIEITDQAGNSISDASGNPLGPWDSSENPSGALQVSFDIPTLGQDQNTSGANIVIFGLPLAALNQSVNLTNANIIIYAGFQAGLPLASSEQAGVILNGVIAYHYGNWEGVHQTLNLIVNSSYSVTVDGAQVSIIMSGKKGELLGDVVKRTLKVAYPSKAVNVNIHQNLTLFEDWNAPYRSLFEFSTFLKRVYPDTATATNYSGIQLVCQKDQIDVFDNTFQPAPIEIIAQNLIGQPTWIEHLKISFKTAMRADLQCGDQIRLPFDIFSILGVNNQYGDIVKDVMNFTGVFQIVAVRQVGDYKGASGEAWVTAFEAVSLGAVA